MGYQIFEPALRVEYEVVTVAPDSTELFVERQRLLWQESRTDTSSIVQRSIWGSETVPGELHVVTYIGDRDSGSELECISSFEKEPQGRGEKAVPAVEHLIFEMEPNLVDRWLGEDHEVWTLGLARYEGFMSKDVWRNRNRPRELHQIILWETKELWKSIPNEDLGSLGARFDRRLGLTFGEDYRITREGHKDKDLYRLLSMRR